VLGVYLRSQIVNDNNARIERWLAQWSRYYELEVTFVTTRQALRFVKELCWYEPLLGGAFGADRQRALASQTEAAFRKSTPSKNAEVRAEVAGLVASEFQDSVSRALLMEVAPRAACGRRGHDSAAPPSLSRRETSQQDEHETPSDDTR